MRFPSDPTAAAICRNGRRSLHPDGVLRQPYYVIGQWPLPGDRRLRAFVSSERGTLHLARVGDDGSELTSEEISECYDRIFPDLLRRLQYFLKDAQTAGDHEAVDGSGQGTGRLGELLVREGLITEAQLEAALRLQAASLSYMPIGHVLVAHNFISLDTLTATLRRHRKSARLGEVLLKAGHITPAQLEEALEHQRGTSLRLGQMLVRLGWLREATMREALCKQLHINFVDLDAIAIDRNLARLIPETFARRYSVIPVLRVDDVLIVAMDNPALAGVIGGLENLIRLKIKTVTTVAQKFRAAMDRLYTSSAQMRPSGGRLFLGPICDYAVAELLMRASRSVHASHHA